MNHLQVDYLPAEPQGKLKNTGVGSLCLLQQIFLTQEVNQGLLTLQMNCLPAELPRVGGRVLVSEVARNIKEVPKSELV